MKYLAHTAQDVYSIYRNAVNSVFPKAKLPKSLKKETETSIYVESTISGSDVYAYEAMWFNCGKSDGRAEVLYITDKTSVPKPIVSVENLFKLLQKMKKGKGIKTVRINEKRSI